MKALECYDPSLVAVFTWSSLLYCTSVCIVNVALKEYNVNWNDEYDGYAWYVLEDWNVHLNDIMSKWRIYSVKHASVWNVMNEEVNMVRSQCHENGNYVKRCVLLYTLTHTFEMNKWN